MKNKKGDASAILILGVILFAVIFMGILLAIGAAVIDFTADTVIPEVSNLGQIGSWNATETASMTATPLNLFIQQAGWMVGLIYVFCFIGFIGFAFAFRGTNNYWLITLYILIVLMAVISSMIISNIYQEFYYDNSNEITDRLQDQTLLGYLMLFNPFIITIIGFIGGIILFSGDGGYYT